MGIQVLSWSYIHHLFIVFVFFCQAVWRGKAASTSTPSASLQMQSTSSQGPANCSAPLPQVMQATQASAEGAPQQQDTQSTGADNSTPRVIVPILPQAELECHNPSTPDGNNNNNNPISTKKAVPVVIDGLKHPSPGRAPPAPSTAGQQPPQASKKKSGAAHRKTQAVGSTAEASRINKKARRGKPAARLPPSVSAGTPGQLGAYLLAHGVLPERAGAYGHQTGQWVADDTIIAVLGHVCSGKASEWTFGNVSYELVACYLDSSSITVTIPDKQLTVPPSQPQCILVVHTSAQGVGHHFSSCIINPQYQLVHAFDSLGGRWPDSRVEALLQSLYPNLDLFGQHGYKISNSTGKVSQTGASCGPWALWMLVAYVLNFRQCRDEETDVVDCSRLKGGALDFWRAVTY